MLVESVCIYGLRMKLALIISLTEVALILSLALHYNHYISAEPTFIIVSGNTRIGQMDILSTLVICTLKGILSCWENFWYVKTGSLVIPNQFLIFPNSTSNPPKFPKNYFFLVRNSTQMALTAPLFLEVEFGKIKNWFGIIKLSVLTYQKFSQHDRIPLIPKFVAKGRE